MKTNKRVIPIILILALFLVVPVFAVFTPSLSQDLRAYWSFENFSDITGNHPDLEGTADFTTGKIGTGIRLNGSINQMLQINDTDAVDLGFSNNETFTLSYWIKTDTYSQGGSRVFGKLDKDSNGWTTLLDNPHGDWMQIYYAQDGSSINLGSSDILLYNWTLATIVRDNNKTKIYINGNLNVSTPNLATPISSTTANFTIGHTVDYSGGWYDGWLDEIGIWNRSLNSSEIAQVYYNYTGFFPSGFLCPYYPLAQAPTIISIYPNATTTLYTTNATSTITFAWRIDKKNRNLINASVYIQNLSNSLVQVLTQTNFTYVNSSGGTLGNTNFTFVYLNWTTPQGASLDYTTYFDAVTCSNRTKSATNTSLKFRQPSPIPIVKLIKPLFAPLNYSGITFQYNVSGLNISNSTLWLYNSTGLFNSFFNSYTEPIVYVNSTLSDENYTWFVEGSNLLNNITLSVNFTFQVFTPYEVPQIPIINLLNPTNLSILNYSGITFNYNISGLNISNSTLWLYNSTALFNSFFNSYTEPIVYVNSTLPNENYTWFVEGSNMLNNITISVNFTFQVFTPYVLPPEPVFPPIIILKSPLNSAQLNYTNITFNYNISDTNVTNSTLYLYDGLGFVNSYFIAYTQAEVYINETLPNQNYSWYVMGSNSANNISTSGNSTFQIFTSPIIITIEAEETTGQFLQSVIGGAGAGLGVIFLALAQSLPILLIGLVIFGIVIAIGKALASYFDKNGILVFKDFRLGSN